MSDDELIERIRAGDEEAAGELIKRHYAPVLRYCGWHCHDLQKAEDLTQETFFRLFQNISGRANGTGYIGKKKFKAYLYTIARHLCIDESRKASFYLLENEAELADECDGIMQIENREEVGYLLNRLSPEQREAVILRFGQQLTFHEIAKITGCNLRTAQSRVRSALKIMRREKEYEG